MGRVANCIGNATFDLDGKTYTLDANDRFSPHLVLLHNEMLQNLRWCPSM